MGFWLGRGGRFLSKRKRRACEPNVTKEAAIFLPAFGKIDTACYSCLSSSCVALALDTQTQRETCETAWPVLAIENPAPRGPSSCMHARKKETQENMPAPSPPSPPQHHVLLLVVLDARPGLAFVVACGTRTQRAHCHDAENSERSSSPQLLRVPAKATVPIHGPRTKYISVDISPIAYRWASTRVQQASRRRAEPSHLIPPPTPIILLLPLYTHSTTTPLHQPSNHGQGSRNQGGV